jgi:fucose permease
MCAVLPVIGLAPAPVVFAAALIAYGMSNGAFDLASNAQGVIVERAAGRSLMSGFHAFFSAGAITGAASAALISAAQVPVETHLPIVGGILAVVVVAARPGLLGHAAGDEQAGPVLAWPGRALLGIAALAFCVLLAEGAVFDWSAVYLNDVAGAPQAVAALGLAVFQAAMMIGRLAGDRVAARLGADVLVRGGAAVGGIGFATALAAPSVPAVFIGYVLLGLGLAASFPLAMSAASRIRSVATPVALGATTAAGYTGFVVGPPLIGLIGEGTSLRVGLGVVLACLAAAVILASSLRVRG